LSPAEYAAAPRLASLIPSGDDAPPASTPDQVPLGDQAGVCATFAPNAAPTLAVVDALPPVTGEARAAGTPGGVGAHADWIAVPPGRGAVVESLASPGGAGGSLAVITDLGQRFAVPSVDVLQKLGYGDVTPQRLPAALVSLVPPGRALDPAAAGRKAIDDV
jgi:hypothetical protein